MDREGRLAMNQEGDHPEDDRNVESSFSFTSSSSPAKDSASPGAEAASMTPAEEGATTPAGEDTRSVPPQKPVESAQATSKDKDGSSSPPASEPRVSGLAKEYPTTEHTPAKSSTPSAAKPTKTEPPAAAASNKTYTVEDAERELKNASGMPACRSLLKDHLALKEKVDKLKSLLGRSAKAQRESKIELDTTQKKLNQAIREIERLNQTLDKLQSRPTHMDLLMDFETNFDKALLSVGQTGGQDTAATPATAPVAEQDSALDAMLMQELGEAKARIDKLESLNSSLNTRSTQLESSFKTLQKERDEARSINSRLQMEVKMAQMEAEHATRAMQDKAASLEEMQMEIDMVTKASAKANMRAAKGEEAANTLKTDRQKVVQLESQMQALQEWALASAESKRLMKERVKILENKLRRTQDSAFGGTGDGDQESTLFSKSGSIVIGAGDRGAYIVRLGAMAENVNIRFVVLRWKFDFSPSDANIGFNIIKGNCKTHAEQNRGEYLIKDRTVTAGAGGETEGAFSLDNACTLMWLNEKSWIRPRTVKYQLDVIAFK